jgi:hypothetical protein
VWQDANGHTRLTLFNTVNPTLITPDPSASVVAALAAQSNAAFLNDVEGTLNVNASPSPVSATYQRVVDSAALTFTDAMGSLVRIQLPAPVSSIFLADQETVDITMIGGIVGAVVGTVVTPAGGVVTAYVSGVRQPTTKENY